jgi:UDP-arabinose 4-epimerase
MNRRILVVGGAGYIGSQTCKVLKQHGYEPFVFDNLGTGHRRFVRWGPLIEGDILDPDALRQALTATAPVAVIHFAAFAYVGESVENPGKYYRNNVVGSLNLLEAMRDTGVGQLVFSSTCATYGVPERLPLTEDHPQNPINPYGAGKQMVERMMSDFAVAHGLKFVVFRYFNAAGADPEGETGEIHHPETHLIPLVLDVAAGKRPHIKVFGTDYDTPDGTCIRDYIHTVDLAEAHVSALRYIEAGGEMTAFNLGNGSGFSVREVISTAEAVTGKPIPLILDARRPGDPDRLVGDAAAARHFLNWVPRFSDLPTIIRHAWDFHRRLP